MSLFETINTTNKLRCCSYLSELILPSKNDTSSFELEDGIMMATIP